MIGRFMTWNIKTGGLDRDGPDRLDAITEVLAEQRPDILALQESFGRRRLGRLASAIGMTPHLARPAFGQPVAVLVRPPLSMTDRTGLQWGMHHAAAGAVVSTGAGALTVVSTHLNPYTPIRRRREAWRIAKRYRGELVLVAGDLNTLEPGIDHAEELARLPERFRKRHLGRDGGVDSRPVEVLLAGGLRDLWPIAGDGDGRTAPTSGGGGHEFSGMRLDYVLGSAAVAARVVGMRVVRGGAAEYASDHYPVVVEFAGL